MKSKNLPALMCFSVGAWLAASFAPAFAQAAPAQEAVLARSGNVTVTQTELERLLKGLPENERAVVKSNRSGIENWMRQRLASEALLNEAQSKGWAERPEIKARIDAAVAEITSRIVTTSYLESIAKLPENYPSEAELRSAYEQGKAKYNVSPTYRISQIYLPAQEKDAASVSKVREEAKKIANQARSGDFAVIARARSQDRSSAERGGEVGTLPLEQMLPEVRGVVSKMKPGQVSDPVQSPSGFHIIKLVEAHPARTATYEEMKMALQSALRQERRQQLVQDYLSKLVPAESFSIDSAALDTLLQKVD